MPTERLHPSQITGLTATWPEDVRRLALDARALVLEIEPTLSEKIAFRALCYFKPDAPYGAIGGNVCLVSSRGAELELAFLHGASLPDPGGLLHGDAKAKRRIAVRSRAELRQPAVADLIRAAVDYEPTP